MLLFWFRTACELQLVSNSSKHALHSLSCLPFCAYFIYRRRGTVIDDVKAGYIQYRYTCTVLNERVGERMHGVQLTEQSYLYIHVGIFAISWCSHQVLGEEYMYVSGA